MEPQFHLGDDLSQLESKLKELAPALGRLDIAQTMFRAGQASAGRPGARQYFWPGTSALLAVVSVTLGVLLAMPDQPQIVYVPVDIAVDGERSPQPTMIAGSRGTVTDNNRSVSTTITDEETSRLDPRWWSLIGSLGSREMVMGNSWDAPDRVATTSPQALIPRLCSGDWRTMVDEDRPGQVQHAPDSPFLLDWKHFLNIRGS